MRVRDAAARSRCRPRWPAAPIEGAQLRGAKLVVTWLSGSAAHRLAGAEPHRGALRARARRARGRRDRLVRAPGRGGREAPEGRRHEDADVAAILALAPDLVIANHEENRAATSRSCEAAGVRGLGDLSAHGARRRGAAARAGRRSARRPRAIAAVVEPVEAAVAEAPRGATARGRASSARSGATPGWRRRATPTSTRCSMLCGGDNVFADRGDRRYPIVKLDEIVAAAPEVILLPDEPYAFGPRDAPSWPGSPSRPPANGRIHFIDGTLVSWYGPRIRPALRGLRSILHPPGLATPRHCLRLVRPAADAAGPGRRVECARPAWSRARKHSSNPPVRPRERPNRWCRRAPRKTRGRGIHGSAYGAHGHGGTCTSVAGRSGGRRGQGLGSPRRHAGQEAHAHRHRARLRGRLPALGAAARRSA